MNALKLLKLYPKTQEDLSKTVIFVLLKISVIFCNKCPVLKVIFFEILTFNSRVFKFSVG